MDFVDHEHFVLADHRRVLSLFQKIADVIDTGIRSRIDFNHIHRMTARNIETAFALSTRNQRITARAVQRFRQDACRGRFTDTTGSRKKERMMQTTADDCIFNRLRDMLLANQIVERFRSPFARHCNISHTRQSL